VLPISDGQREAADAVTRRLRAAGLRATLDAGSATLNYRIRDGEVHKVPYMAIIGQREADAGTAAVRVRGAGNKQEVIPVEALVERLVTEARERRVAP
jgi:threonyl-tRNA synthetase